MKVIEEMTDAQESPEYMKVWRNNGFATHGKYISFFFAFIL